MKAAVTHFRRISWIDHNDRHPRQKRFIFNKAAKLIECPFAVQTYLLFRKLELQSSLALRSLKAFSNAFKFLYYYTFTLLFGKAYHLLRNRMVYQNLCPSLFSGKTFQNAFRIFRSFRLEGRTYILPLYFIIIKFLG